MLFRFILYFFLIHFFFFISFVSFCVSCILFFLKGVRYLWKICLQNFFLWLGDANFSEFILESASYLTMKQECLRAMCNVLKHGIQKVRKPEQKYRVGTFLSAQVGIFSFLMSLLSKSKMFRSVLKESVVPFSPLLFYVSRYRI